MLIELTENTFNEQIWSGITLVDFYGSNCGPCKILGKLMPHIAKKYEWSADVALVNSAQNFSLAAQYGIHAVPTVLLFKDGVELTRLKWLHPPETYKELMERITSSTSE